jgi:hypothetical protein
VSWWTISGEALLAALRQVEAGDPADVVYLELEANAEHEESEG